MAHTFFQRLSDVNMTRGVGHMSACRGGGAATCADVTDPPTTHWAGVQQNSACHLRGEEEVRAIDARLADRGADIVLVAVELGAVEEAIADVERVEHTALRRHLGHVECGIHVVTLSGLLKGVFSSCRARRHYLGDEERCWLKKGGVPYFAHAALYQRGEMD